jgi:hypothetical protein
MSKRQPKPPREPIKLGADIQIEGHPPSQEWMWARRISKDTAKIDNIPFFVPDIGLGDLVKFDPSTNMIVQVIEKCSHTRHARFDFARTPEETLERWGKVREHLKGHDIHVEGMGKGYFSLAVPLDLDEEQLRGAVATCPVPLVLCDD